MTETILEVAGVEKKFKGFHLDNISFAQPKGSIMGFVGENGAGKTTTIKLILNMIRRDAGEIQVLGLDNIRDELAVKEQVGVVLDESFINQMLTPQDMEKIFRRIYRAYDSRLYFEFLDRFELPRKKAVKEFSKGMRMKLAIAAALSHHPRFLILDEATSGLDPIVRNEILDLFLEFIQDEEKAIFFSSHITNDLDKIADYITFLHKGSIIFSEARDRLNEKYGIMRCGSDEFSLVDPADLVAYRKNQFGYEMLVRDKESMRRKYRGLVIDNAAIDEIMYFYVKGTRVAGGKRS